MDIMSSLASSTVSLTADVEQEQQLVPPGSYAAVLRGPEQARMTGIKAIHLLGHVSSNFYTCYYVII